MALPIDIPMTYDFKSSSSSALRWLRWWMMLLLLLLKLLLLLLLLWKLLSRELWVERAPSMEDTPSPSPSPSCPQS